MSSNIYNVDFHTNHRILKQMMTKAGYLTSKMKPLPGPYYNQSALILRNFMAGAMGDVQTDADPQTEGTSAYVPLDRYCSKMVPVVTSRT
ncbi:hypothetical protein HGG72_16850 [Ochrobactrum pecoris]|uniref:Uncharacterized protein n=1 Tax=Brucella pecoris TaxID=867683 RepID=A0A5C5CGQ4_9HYPH|nr:hypothetical protein [Brucella pecoris]MBB4095284.1 hypothetical protein [Brucella pecoris]NKW81596.1 hypothetical protein [Brucella pecoris]TNV10500.1 hypothetical protein FIB18_16140 [Brucella pecoris]